MSDQEQQRQAVADVQDQPRQAELKRQIERQHKIERRQRRDECRRRANYRRVRLEVAARLMPSFTVVAERDFDYCSSVAVRLADALIAANEAMPVPAATNRSGPQNDNLPSTLPTAPSAGDSGAAGKETA